MLKCECGKQTLMRTNDCSGVSLVWNPVANIALASIEVNIPARSFIGGQVLASMAQTIQ